MRSAILGLALLIAAVLFHGAESASAAALGVVNAFGQALDDDVVKVQGYGGGGYDGGRRRGGYDDDGYGDRERRWNPRGHREYCWSCARRCSDGWCPPRCWGWWRKCRRDRGY